MDSWKLYDALIDAIPDDVSVRDYCLGVNWSYVDADCGMGIAYTARGGAKSKGGDFRGYSLKEMATLSKSWCFDEATLGIAALNAWHSRDELITPHNPVRETKEILPDGTKVHHNDAFELMRPKIEAFGGDAKVVVIGHFPHVDRIAEYARLTVLERNCRDALDMPDPACEYVIPEADFVFQTGVTLTNKTAPRLLALGNNATTIMVGPSVVATPMLFDFGVDVVSGSIVKDPEKIAFSCKAGTVGIPFGDGLERISISPSN